MPFNLDPSKQAQEVLFSHKVTKTNKYYNPNIIFNGNTVQKKCQSKVPWYNFGRKSKTLNDHITSKLTTVNKLISTLRKLYYYMARDPLITSYKSFIRSYLDYDVALDKSSNATFSNRVESAQYNAALAITGTIRGTSKEKLYQELGFETMKERRWFRKSSTSLSLQFTLPTK